MSVHSLVKVAGHTNISLNMIHIIFHYVTSYKSDRLMYENRQLKSEVEGERINLRIELGFAPKIC